MFRLFDWVVSQLGNVLVLIIYALLAVGIGLSIGWFIKYGLNEVIQWVI